jgi:acyl-CoA dehydrogenase
METIHFTEKHKAFRKRVREFFDKEVVSYIEQWEADKIVPRSVWKKMGEQGFLCTYLPEKYGGMGGDFLYSVIVAEELARTNHYGLFAFLHSDIVVPYIYAFGSEELKDKYLPGCITGDIITAVAMTEPDAGSDLASLAATAVEDGDSVIINGTKIFISNGLNCDIAITAAKDPSEKNPHKAISLYIVEDGTPGFQKGLGLDKMGMHSQDTAELFFSNCRIPKTNRLGKKGEGFLMLMNKLQQERLVCSIISMACAATTLKTTIQYCRGSIKPGQSCQFQLAEMATEIKIGKTFLYSLIADHMAGKKIDIETSMAKYWTSELAHKVVDRCLEIYGLEGSLARCPLERTWRDVKVMTIFAGTNEIMRQIIAKSLNL